MMMMMQRLLQDGSPDTASLTTATGAPRHFNFNSGNILHHHPSSAFLSCSRSEDNKDSEDSNPENSERNSRFDESNQSDSACKDRKVVVNTVKDDIFNRIRICKTPEDKSGSDESMDVEDSKHERIEDRLSSEEDFLTVDDEIGSPVDLTNRHRFLKLHNRRPTMLSSDKIVFSRQPDVSSPSTVSEANEDRRIAFSVENILDPNKFTGKDKDFGLLKPRYPTQWRPHMDIMANSSDLITSGR